jgi:hypothetical protein
MKKITFKDYKKALLEHYATTKSNDVTGILIEPTPAQLRDLCSLKIERGLTKTDEELMKVFFETKKEESLKLSVRRCNIDKFKPIIHFLKREKDTENSTRIELVAILIDFTPRPYAKFSGMRNDIKDKYTESTEMDDNHVAEDTELKNKKAYKKVFYVVLGLIGFSSVGYVVKDKLIPEKQCMQWQNDHYELIDCQSNINSIYAASPIVPIDEDMIELNKLKVSDTTTFFKGGKAIIWYCKVDGKPEYFDDSGFHPVTGNALRPVSNYIINKYVKGK